jgi:hypothetical protein
MRKSKPTAHDMKRHSDIQRDAMEDIKELESAPQSTHNDIKYVDPNRDRAVGDADRTGRHFDEFVEASEDGEAD